MDAGYAPFAPHLFFPQFLDDEIPEERELGMFMAIIMLTKCAELWVFGDRIHTMSADGELMMTILASYAQEESRSASENQTWRIRRGFERGELINLRFLFGYKIEKAAWPLTRKRRR